MNGVVLFGTIIASLLLGYSKGINTKRKKIVSENKQLKKELAKLRNEIKKLKTIKYDYEIETGAFVKKDYNRFIKDIILSIKLDHTVKQDYIALAALLSSSDMSNSDDKFDLVKLNTMIEKVRCENDVIEIGINQLNYTYETWNLDQSIKNIFLYAINIDEYDLTYHQVYNSIINAVCEISENDKPKKIEKIRRAFARD